VVPSALKLQLHNFQQIAEFSFVLSGSVFAEFSFVLPGSVFAEFSFVLPGSVWAELCGRWWDPSAVGQ
jgi:hypothetical protein